MTLGIFEIQADYSKHGNLKFAKFEYSKLKRPEKAIDVYFHEGVILDWWNPSVAIELYDPMLPIGNICMLGTQYLEVVKTGKAPILSRIPGVQLLPVSLVGKIYHEENPHREFAVKNGEFKLDLYYIHATNRLKLGPKCKVSTIGGGKRKFIIEIDQLTLYEASFDNTFEIFTVVGSPMLFCTDSFKSRWEKAKGTGVVFENVPCVFF